ncbi:uncharacterized protein LOC111340026 [Stylophora pistillata]|uniref:uncharacterized protein LOC111340026 n=1 Tax=Stylophora pistillata TaxID=50429 RepID=UPI000C056CF9|nr:uncharacterized protein LOC111340026 [Stylophora pistillata]
METKKYSPNGASDQQVTAVGDTIVSDERCDTREDDYPYTLEGYLHQLSPIKTATKSQTNFFDCSLKTSEKESVRLVCYSPKQRPTLQQAFKKKSPIKIIGTRKHTKRLFSDKEEYTLSKSAKLHSTILAFPYNDKFDNKLHTCEEALEAPIYQRIHLKVKKQPDKQAVVENDKTYYKVECMVADRTNPMKSIFWEDTIDKVSTSRQTTQGLHMSYVMVELVHTAYMPCKLVMIAKIGIDPVTIPEEELDAENLPPVERSDLFSFLVLETSYYTTEQFKNYKSLEAYNQVVSGFVASVKGYLVLEKHVVVAKVRHSQRMNDSLVTIWIIHGTNGRVFSAHCLGCKAGLAESCSHIASVLIYLECWTRINGKLACTQVKCTWLLPTYVDKVAYARAKEINFTSAKKLKEELDSKIDSFDGKDTRFDQNKTVKPKITSSTIVSAQEVLNFYERLNKCETKAAVLTLIDPYADQFVSKSRNVPVVTDLYEPRNLDLKYTELLNKCLEVEINISEEEIEIVEQDTKTQAKGSGFFRHRAGRIGASVCGAAYHTNIAQPSQSLIQSVCYPHLFKLNIKAVKYGCKYEESAIRAYEQVMKQQHINFELKRCGLFINKEYPYIHATPDFLVSCDCCGLGCGEVKCPISIKDGNFEEYSHKSTSCLEDVNGKLKLRRTHNYYYQVQQQLFTLPERKFCDFVVFSRDSQGNSQIVCDRINPDTEHSKNVLSKLEVFWRICILPEMLGRWYTRRCDQPDRVPDENAICFCRGSHSDGVIPCSNVDCPYGKFHKTCLALDNVSIPKKWYCPHCCKLSQYQKGKKASNQKVQSTIHQAAMKYNTICVCNGKASTIDRLVECHNTTCKNEHFFHLWCLGLKRLPNNSKTTWLCPDCSGKKTTTTTSASSLPESPVASNL